MNMYSVINIKTDPHIKNRAMRVAKKLGISINAVLNNELRRFASEESVTFDMPPVPNARTRKMLAQSRAQLEKGDYYRFRNNKEAVDFLRDELR
ncbi:type II toxin-antitoxin system RelB/DinJ family antitoxin [Candidatus Uhrbacteria bacterium]|nr:type II toxin-antitoxin system RelB/DinJ family antitoxin [Candidatus Uhrbacteria bacterium]